MAMPHAMEERAIKMVRIIGIGVPINFIRTMETSPRRHNVTRSPRQEATGGAMLSVSPMVTKEAGQRSEMTCRDHDHSIDRGQ